MRTLSISIVEVVNKQVLMELYMRRIVSHLLDLRNSILGTTGHLAVLVPSWMERRMFLPEQIVVSMVIAENC